jgi:acetylornithine deacetylase/succinyl-diaminopimelate desuccinylase-like protein
MRKLLVDTLSEHGVDPEVDDAGNVLASKEGVADGPHIVLNTHNDTVPPHVPYQRRADPPAPGEEVTEEDTDPDGEIVAGRGSCDAKGPLAAHLDAFLAAAPKRGRLTLAITPDEEVYSTGAAALDLDADGYVVGEPTGLDVCHAARGRFEGTVTITGESGHAAKPGSGVNAIRASAPILQALESFDETVGPGAHESLGRPTLEPTVIEGGDATNQIAAECQITIDRRSVPPETADGFAEQLQSHLRSWIPDVYELTFEFTERETPFLEAFATDETEPLVQTLADASGGNVWPFGAATEASYFAADAPTVIFGPGVLADEEGPVAHSDREYVRLPEIEAAGEAIRETLAELQE